MTEVSIRINKMESVLEEMVYLIGKMHANYLLLDQRICQLEHIERMNLQTTTYRLQTNNRRVN
ncbi:hypothetical protein J2S13_000507 [Oikeobacillus pervagus]|uniref:Uncharacterized protein n=1 Tax=Oikeobacillus pervagus TaxID=1325931 RepID=A0AAJ1WJH3_9BACI|nr:hypothetical protein [Oikeobacillus pervagus]MDQ0214111.1 hypothetical protein [Oikeobacillus pervagus]